MIKLWSYKEMVMLKNITYFGNIFNKTLFKALLTHKFLVIWKTRLLKRMNFLMTANKS